MISWTEDRETTFPKSPLRYPMRERAVYTLRVFGLPVFRRRVLIRSVDR